MKARFRRRLPPRPRWRRRPMHKRRTRACRPRRSLPTPKLPRPPLRRPPYRMSRDLRVSRPQLVILLRHSRSRQLRPTTIDSWLVQHGVRDLFRDELLRTVCVVARVHDCDHLQLVGRTFQRRARDDHSVVNLVLWNIVVWRQSAGAVHRLTTRLVGFELLGHRIVWRQGLAPSLLSERIDWLI